jgi:hypothetical protein
MDTRTHSREFEMEQAEGSRENVDVGTPNPAETGQHDAGPRLGGGGAAPLAASRLRVLKPLLEPLISARCNRCRTSPRGCR